MSIISTQPPPSLWEQACKEVQEEREQLVEKEPKQHPVDMENFDPSTHHPAFYGKHFAQIFGDYNVRSELDQSVGHPACASYWMSDESTRSEDVPESPPVKKTCSNREFLEHYVWPCLLPGLEKALVEATRQGCFGLKKVPFNSLDFLTEYLYNHNPMFAKDQRPQLPLLEIPFVKDWLALHPRPPQPVSLSWTEDETATKIQSAWRGYLVRRDPEVQELRKWQEEWRFINREGHIAEEVSGFWDRLMPDYTSSTHLSSDQTGQRRRSSQDQQTPKQSPPLSDPDNSGS